MKAKGRARNPIFSSRQSLVQALNDNGNSPMLVAKKYGRSRVSVHNWMKRFGIEKPKYV